MMLIKGHIFLCLYLPWLFLSFHQGLIWPKPSTHNFCVCGGRQAFWRVLCRVITNSVSGTQLCWGCCSLSQTLHAASGCWRCSPPRCLSTLRSLAGPKHHYRFAFLPALLRHQQHGLPGSHAQPPLQPTCSRSFCCVIRNFHLGRSWRLLLIKQIDYDGVWSSTGCLTNTSGISGLPLTVLICEGEQHSSFTCPVSEALLF